MSAEPDKNVHRLYTNVFLENRQPQNSGVYGCLNSCSPPNTL